MVPGKRTEGHSGAISSTMYTMLTQSNDLSPDWFNEKCKLFKKKKKVEYVIYQIHI